VVSVKYLLDTNIVSEPLRPRPNAKILAQLKRHADELALASLVWHELWFGCERLPASNKRSAIEEYLNKVVAPSMAILPYDERAAFWHAQERARLTAQGKPPPFVDGQIAAIAYVNDITLVTLNPSDYAAFKGIKLENWSR
jgi:tRNA(fMet)-specific endonuclease VapC